MKKTIALFLSAILLIPTLISNVSAAPQNVFLWPVPSSYSMSRAYSSSHKAIDIQKCANQDILASYDGVVFKLDKGTNSSSWTDDSYGTSMILKHTINGSTYYTHYAHMVEGSIPQKFRTIGATVKQGEIIGKVGKTGTATGYHLHFCIADGSDVWKGRFDNTPTDSSKHNITKSNGVSYIYSTTHTHDFSVFLWYWKAHPHYNEYRCAYCDATEVRKNETNYLASCETCNHVHSHSVTATYPATCTTDGYYVYTCSCGDSYTSTYQYALGHDFSNYDYTESSHPHYKVYKCSRSGCYETSRSSEASYDSNCSQCNPAPSVAAKVTVTPGNSNTSTVIKWDARDVAANDIDEADYFNVRVYRQQNGSYSLSSIHGVGYSISNLYPSVSLDLPAGSYYTEIVTVCGENESLTSCTDKYYFTVEGTTYTVSYNANGGSGAPSSQTKNHGVSLTLTSSVPTKNYTITYNANGGSVSPSSKTLNCKFVKWNTAANGSGTSYNSGATYSSNSSVTLYAQYATPTAGTLATPTRSGYTFDGWYTAANGGTKVTASTVISKNTTVYAHWTKKAEPTTKPTVTLSSISIKTYPNETEYNVGETFNSSGLTLTAKYSDGTSKTITSSFTCSKPDMTTAGTKKVTVTYGGKTASFNITVAASTVKATSVDIVVDQNFGDGNVAELSASVNPSNASYKSIIWSSSDTSIATVDSDGTVTTHGNSGEAIITVTVTNHDGTTVSDTIEVNVSGGSSSDTSLFGAILTLFMSFFELLLLPFTFLFAILF